MRRVLRAYVVLCATALVVAVSVPATWAAQAARAPEKSKKIDAEGSITAFGPTVLTLLPATSDGTIPYELSWHVDGDLAGDVTTSGTITIDATAGTMTEHATEKFVGTVKGLGKGTLTWSSTWTGPIGATSRDYVAKVTGGTGKLKKVRGHGEESLQVAGGEFVFPGTYTFTLKKRSG